MEQKKEILQELVNRYHYPEEEQPQIKIETPAKLQIKIETPVEPQVKIETPEEAEIRWKQFQERELMMQAMLPKYYVQGNQKPFQAQERQIGEEQPKYECQLSIKKICKLFLICCLTIVIVVVLGGIYGFLFPQQPSQPSQPSQQQNQ